MDSNASEKPRNTEASQREARIRDFWKENRIFEKSLEKKAPKGEFVFYDGPPFATGLPHYGHILAGIIKDAIPRFKTMQGYRVRRRWGWDCHGLPLETLIEKELGLETKKDIEDMGIAEFNRVARESVLRYADDWREIVPQTGRWVDMDRDYRTMDWTYTESVWWAFKTLYEKGLLYESFKSMHVCPRCETTLSNFEVSQGYAEITDFAVTAALPLVEEPDTALLVWTTTPWTLPGNMAAAVNENIVYGKYKLQNASFTYYIAAKDRAPEVFKGYEYELVQEYKGSELVGKEYNPPFAYYQEEDIPNKKNAWKIYAAPYVTTEEGTGIVHLAPAFGEDDLKLAQENSIPVVHHVGMNGVFAPAVHDFAGMHVKPKDDHTGTDVHIIKHLARAGRLFSKEKITHSYPLCWRCDTPLLNYAANSWFVAVTNIKDKLIAANKKIGWVPHEIRDGRFGKWLEGVRDWAISRARFWGAPLPVWRCENCNERAFVGSVKELESRYPVKTPLFLVRHGEAESNRNNRIDASGDEKNHLTENGKEAAHRAGQELKHANIKRIYVSPLIRTKETARIIAEEIGLSADAIIEDERLRETGVGVYDGKPVEEFHKHFETLEEWFDTPVPEGESLADIKKRTGDFVYEKMREHEGEPILVVSHSDPLWALAAAAAAKTRAEMLAMRKGVEHFIQTGEVKRLEVVPLPHGEEYAIELHRPYIDEIVLSCTACSGVMRRVPDVFDCWFESGSMPYGQYHYPFENTDIFNPHKNKGFPADFIAEGMDQTRGWFYSTLVLSVALFGKKAYKHVIVNGLVLAEDGRKMSKKLGNYPDPVAVMETYGADAMRMYLFNAPVVRGDDLQFSESGVQEIQNKVVRRLWNIYSFYELYKNEESARAVPSGKNVLDQWIRVRLAETANKVTDAMNSYELDKAVRPIIRFVDDFSTWYLRRSRERFKSADAQDQRDAIATTRRMLLLISKISAPFMPFITEDVYQRVRHEGDPESVHLTHWPKRDASIPVWPNPKALLHRVFGTHGDFRVLASMEEVRRIVTEALEARANAGIKVRQPLQTLTIQNEKSPIRGKEEYLKLIRDEVNVKTISFDASIDGEIALDTAITEPLRREGEARELVRGIQDLRKKKGLAPGDKPVLVASTNDAGKNLIKDFENELLENASLQAIEIRDAVSGEEIVAGNARITASFEE